MAPGQWLWDIESSADGYARLVSESGSVALAAYRLAKAQCQARSVPTDVPTGRELMGAASFIAKRLGLPESAVIRSMLNADCEAAGLPVI